MSTKKQSRIGAVWHAFPKGIGAVFAFSEDLRLAYLSDMSQEELANKIETSRSYISALEHDEYEPKLETMKKVAKAFKISLDVLVKGL